MSQIIVETIRIKGVNSSCIILCVLISGSGMIKTSTSAEWANLRCRPIWLKCHLTKCPSRFVRICSYNFVTAFVGHCWEFALSKKQRDLVGVGRLKEWAWVCYVATVTLYEWETPRQREIETEEGESVTMMSAGSMSLCVSIVYLRKCVVLCMLCVPMYVHLGR